MKKFKSHYRNKRLLCICPHPDDEACFFGGTIVKYVQLGVKVYILLLTNGELGRQTVFKGNKEIVLDQDKTNKECLAKIRLAEFRRSIKILGLEANSAFYANLPNTLVNQNAISYISKAIEVLDPHVIISFNEAGTTRLSNPDHSWSAFDTFASVRQLLSRGVKLSFENYYTYSLPNPQKYLDEYSEIDLANVKTSNIIICKDKQQKKEAASKHYSQKHLIDYFQEAGLFDLDTEIYIKRIGSRSSIKSSNNDLFETKDDRSLGKPCIIRNMPMPSKYYMSSSPAIFSLLQARKNIINRLVL